MPCAKHQISLFGGKTPYGVAARETPLGGLHEARGGAIGRENTKKTWRRGTHLQAPCAKHHVPQLGDKTPYGVAARETPLGALHEAPDAAVGRETPLGALREARCAAVGRENAIWRGGAGNTIRRPARSTIWRGGVGKTKKKNDVDDKDEKASEPGDDGEPSAFLSLQRAAPKKATKGVQTNKHTRSTAHRP